MSKRRLESGGDPSFADPFKHALNRMQEREILTPKQYRDRAEGLLNEKFGPSDRAVRTGFSYGSAGIQADHTHYFNGFALLKLMHQGAAVALRSIEQQEARIVFEGDAAVYRFEENRLAVDTGPVAARTVAAVLAAFNGTMDGGLEIAVVVTVPIGFDSAYLASVAVATARALETPVVDQFATIRGVIETVLESPFSVAYVIGSSIESPIPFVLVDTETLEHLIVESPSNNVPDWALVDTTGASILPNRTARTQMCEEILARLQQKGFGELNSLRDLEHRDLETAMNVLSRRHRPALRSLVTDNRRVQRFVAAIRNQDWQLLGALLLMSHASRRDDWMGTSAIHDFVVDSAERFSLEGVYGAARTGEGPFVLVACQPFRLHTFLDHLRNNWPDQATGEPDIINL